MGCFRKHDRCESSSSSSWIYFKCKKCKKKKRKCDCKKHW